MKKTIFTTFKILISLVVFIFPIICCTSCETESEKVRYNLSQEADNFNIVRQVTVIDCITGDVLFQMSGRMSVIADTSDNQLEIIVESDGKYQKHIIGLSDNVTYVVEDLNLGDNDVSQYKYTINYNPKMWLPYKFENVD